MKKLISTLLIFALVFSLAGCSNDVKELDSDEINIKNGNDKDIDEDIEENIDEEDNSGEDARESEKESSDKTDISNLFNLDFSLGDGRGNTINISEEYKGEFVFLNFFTTWCGYCMEEMPEFQSFHEAYGDKAEVVIVNVQQDPGEKSVEDVLEWYDSTGYEFPIVFDIDAKDTEQFYPYIQGYPTTFVFDEEGDFLGYIPAMTNEAMMVDILNNHSSQ